MELRSSRRLSALALLLLLTLACYQQSLARLGIVWRLTVLSWDSPATQLEDETATQGLAYADPSRQAREQTSGALRPIGRLVTGSDLGSSAVPSLDSDLTRSPPSS